MRCLDEVYDSKGMRIGRILFYLIGFGCQKPWLRSAPSNLHKKVVRLPLCGAFR